MNRLWCIIVACMLNNCVVSDIGGTIRSRGEQHFSVDRGRPEVVYLDADSLRRRMLAPEVTYRGQHHGLVYDNLTNASWLGEPEVTDTGRLLWVEDIGWTHSSYELTTAPSGEWKRVERKKTFTTPLRELSPHETKQVGNRTLRTILAAPFDYLIDPALTLTYTGLFYCGELVWLPFFAVGNVFFPAEPSAVEVEPVEWGQM